MTMGWTTKLHFLKGHELFQTDSCVNPASYPTDAGTLSPEVKWPEHKADHSPPLVLMLTMLGALSLHTHTSSRYDAFAYNEYL